MYGGEVNVSEPGQERTTNSPLMRPQMAWALSLCFVPSPPTVLRQML